MINRILIDSSFLYELNNPKTSRRTEAQKFAQVEKRARIVPDVVLTEAVYLIRKRIGQNAAINFLQHIDTMRLRFEPVLSEDLFDFVDCCLMAMSERLSITSIYTFDRRVFTIFRPTHCDFLELLP